MNNIPASVILSVQLYESQHPQLPRCDGFWDGVRVKQMATFIFISHIYDTVKNNYMMWESLWQCLSKIIIIMWPVGLQIFIEAQVYSSYRNIHRHLTVNSGHESTQKG